MKGDDVKMNKIYKKILAIVATTALVIGIIPFQVLAVTFTDNTAANITVASSAGDSRKLYDGHMAKIDIAWTVPAGKGTATTFDIGIPTYQGFEEKLDLSSPAPDTTNGFFYWYGGNTAAPNSYKKSATTSGGTVSITSEVEGKIVFSVPAGQTSGIVSVYRNLAVDGVTADTTRNVTFSVKSGTQSAQNEVKTISVEEPYVVTSSDIVMKDDDGDIYNYPVNNIQEAIFDMAWKWNPAKGVYPGDIIRVKLNSRAKEEVERPAGAGFTLTESNTPATHSGSAQQIGTLYTDSNENIFLLFNNQLSGQQNVSGNIHVSTLLVTDNVTVTTVLPYKISINGIIVIKNITADPTVDPWMHTYDQDFYKWSMFGMEYHATGKPLSYDIRLNYKSSEESWKNLSTNASYVPAEKTGAYYEDVMHSGIRLDLINDAGEETFLISKEDVLFKGREAGQRTAPFNTIFHVYNGETWSGATLKQFVQYATEVQGATTPPSFWDIDGNEYIFKYQDNKFYFNGTGYTMAQMDAKFVKFRLYTGKFTEKFNKAKSSANWATWVNEIAFAENKTTEYALQLAYFTEVVSKNYDPKTNKEVYKNTGTFAYNTNKVETRTETISFQRNGATATGNMTNLMIYKLSKDDPTQGLNGAEFTLYKKNSGNWDIEDKAYSNPAGQVLFQNIAIGDYKVKETAPPPGYKGVTKEYTFSVTVSQKGWVKLTDDADIDVIRDGNDAFGNAYWYNKFYNCVDISNQKIIGVTKIGATVKNYLREIEIVKEDVADPSKNDLVATFHIYDKLTTNDTSPLYVYKTGQSPVQKISLTNGNYYMKEMAAPNDYMLNSTEYTITVSDSGIVIGGGPQHNVGSNSMKATLENKGQGRYVITCKNQKDTREDTRVVLKKLIVNKDGNTPTAEDFKNAGLDITQTINITAKFRNIDTNKEYTAVINYLHGVSTSVEIDGLPFGEYKITEILGAPFNQTPVIAYVSGAANSWSSSFNSSNTTFKLIKPASPDPDKPDSQITISLTNKLRDIGFGDIEKKKNLFKFDPNVVDSKTASLQIVTVRADKSPYVGATTFRIMDRYNWLKFDYDANTDTYTLNPAGAFSTITVRNGSTTLRGLTDVGTYTLEMLSYPAGTEGGFYLTTGSTRRSSMPIDIGLGEQVKVSAFVDNIGKLP